MDYRKDTIRSDVLKKGTSKPCTMNTFRRLLLETSNVLYVSVLVLLAHVVFHRCIDLSCANSRRLIKGLWNAQILVAPPPPPPSSAWAALPEPTMRRFNLLHGIRYIFLTCLACPFHVHSLGLTNCTIQVHAWTPPNITVYAVFSILVLVYSNIWRVWGLFEMHLERYDIEHVAILKCQRSKSSKYYNS
jgi:hypothetical protein